MMTMAQGDLGEKREIKIYLHIFKNLKINYSDFNKDIRVREMTTTYYHFLHVSTLLVTTTGNTKGLTPAASLP